MAELEGVSAPIVELLERALEPIWVVAEGRSSCQSSGPELR